MKKIAVFLFIIMCFAMTSVSAEPPREGYTLMFNDEFDGNELNSSVWHYREEDYVVRGGRNTRDNVSVKDGKLSIKFTKENGTYFGGGVITNFGLGYGYYEVCSKLFGGTGGLHSSFWTAGVNGDGIESPKYNRSIEIDFYEVDSDKPRKIAPNFHYWLGGHIGGPKSIVKENGKNLFENVLNSSEEYFVCGCEYLPDRIIWYLNGTKVCETSNYEMYGRPNIWLTALANTELSGEIDDKALPGESSWDYFRFYTMPFKNENLIVNPSFDDNNRKNYTQSDAENKMENPVSWLEIGDEDAIKVVDSDDKIRTGSGALCVGKQGEFEAEASQKLKYIANGTYNFSVYIKNEFGAEVEVFVGDKQLKVDKTGENYQKIEINGIEISDNFAYIGVRVKGNGTAVYVDDICLSSENGTDEFNRKIEIDSNKTNEIPGEIIADNEDENCKITGEWLKSSINGFKGTSIYSNKKGDMVEWTIGIPSDGYYAVQLYKVIYGNSATSVPCSVYVNDEKKAEDFIDLTEGDEWHTFGTFSLKKDDIVKISVECAGGYARADSVRLVPGEAFLVAQKGLALKLGERRAYIDYSKRFIDPDNKSVVPYISENDRTMVPLRFIAEALKATVLYEEKSDVRGRDLITIILGDKKVMFSTGVKEYMINDEKKILDTPPENKEDRTFIPLRALAEAFDMYVSYEESGIITVTEEPIINNGELLRFNEYLFENKM